MLSPVENTRKDVAILTCYLKDFFPQEVYVSWLINDQEVDQKYSFHTTNSEKYNSTYVAYGHLMVPLNVWKGNDMTFSCLVYHESVADTTRTIVRSIVQKDLNCANTVNLDLTIPDKCRAK